MHGFVVQKEQIAYSLGTGNSSVIVYSPLCCLTNQMGFFWRIFRQNLARGQFIMNKTLLSSFVCENYLQFLTELCFKPFFIQYMERFGLLSHKIIVWLQKAYYYYFYGTFWCLWSLTTVVTMNGKTEFTGLEQQFIFVWIVLLNMHGSFILFIFFYLVLGFVVQNEQTAQSL